MSVTVLLSSLSALGVELWFEGDRLRFRAPPGALSPELRLQIGAQRAEVLAALRAQAAARTRVAPLSYSQRGMWFVNQEQPASAAYNVAFAVKVSSLVDLGALRHALQALIDRHAVLRTCYEMVDGVPMQRVAGTALAALDVHDVDGLTGDALHARIQADYQRPFDLERGPVLRASLFTRAPEEHVLLLVVHHIAIDGWSLLLLLEELRVFLVEGHGGPAAALPRPEVQYTDYTDWQARMLGGQEGEQLARYWQQKLAAPRAEIELPTDRPRPPRRGGRGATLDFHFDAELTRRLGQLARDEGTTLYVVLLAAFKTLLFRYTGTEDVIVGTPTFGRSQQEFARVLGDFINPVPLRSRVSADMPFRELMGQIRRTLLEALDGQEFPMAMMVERLQPARDPSRSPLFETMFVLQRFEQFRELNDLLVAGTNDTPVDFGGLRVQPYALEQQEGQFDLGLGIIDRADALSGAFKYNTALFDEATIRRMAGHYRTLLEGLIHQPEATVASLPMLTSEERDWLLRDVRGRAAVHADAVYPRLFEAQAERSAQSVAVSFQGDTLTYAQLNVRANRVAHRLRALGVGPGSLVGVCLHRSIELLVALLGVQKSGGAYVPLDPGFPADRLSFMLGDSAATVMLTGGDAAEGIELPEGVHALDLLTDATALAAASEDNLSDSAAPADPAYVIYTSGSTGKPKGVVVPHAALANFLHSMQREPGLVASDVLAAVTTISFDIAALELYLPWLVGARVELVSRETAADGMALAERLAASGATVLQATPATWRLLLEGGWAGSSSLRALCGGEGLPRELAEALLGRCGELWNLYGPTETTVWSTVERVRHCGDAVAIGRPIDNTQVHVLSAAGELLPAGISGELWIGGAGVAIGYHRRPELTAARFVPDRFSAQAGARLYRTGDLGRWRADGRLEHLGRIDHQVKIRGFRIELGEIEANLAAHLAVRQGVVVARAAGPGDLRLVAYIVFHTGEDLTVSDVRRHLRRELPDYMIPSVVVALDTMPLTPNGKVDRAALPDPFKNAVLANKAFVAPEAGAEQTMATIWRDILQIDTVGAEDNFFELGGHSLLSLRVAAVVQKQLGWRMDARTLFFQNLRQVVALASAGQQGGTP